MPSPLFYTTPHNKKGNLMAKIEMTEELAEQLSGLLPISIDTRKKFTPSVYKSKKFPAKFAPVFVLRPMTKMEKMSFVLCNSEDKTTRDDIVYSCVDKAENLWNIETRQVCQLTRELFDALRFDVLAEIQAEILKISGLVDAEKLGLK